MSAKTTIDVGQPEFQVAYDYKFVDVEMFGLAVATKKDGSKTCVLTVFDTMLVPDSTDGISVSVKAVRNAVVGLSMPTEAAKALWTSLGSALSDLGEIEPQSPKE